MVEHQLSCAALGDLSDSQPTRIHAAVRAPKRSTTSSAHPHVWRSVETPEYTADVDGCGALAAGSPSDCSGWRRRRASYQASTSEAVALVQETPAKETTPFHPRSPYAWPSLCPTGSAVNYRELRLVRLQRHPLQHEDAAPRRNLRHPHRYARRLANIAQGWKVLVRWATSTRCATGGMPRTTFFACSGWMLQQEHPKLRHRHRAPVLVREFITWTAAELGVALRFDGHGVDREGPSCRGPPPTGPALEMGDVRVGWDPRTSAARPKSDAARRPRMPKASSAGARITAQRCAARRGERRLKNAQRSLLKAPRASTWRSARAARPERGSPPQRAGG